jgi:hypothetical protein
MAVLSAARQNSIQINDNYLKTKRLLDNITFTLLILPPLLISV